MQYEVKLPNLVTSDGVEQFLTYDPNKKNYFACRKTNHYKQTFEYEEIPEEYRQQATRVSKRWKPGVGDRYWFIGLGIGTPMTFIWDEDSMDELLFSIGNVFKTEVEAAFEIERLKVAAELKEFSKPFEKNKYNFHIIYDHKVDKLIIGTRSFAEVQGAIYFDSVEIVEKAIDAAGEDRIKKYLFGVE